jgi:AcrR family transcriptional regulator
MVYICNFMKVQADLPLGRREKALITRRRMLRAAYELFCERGYAGTTMGLIAERAGVAVQTLYFTFNTKLAILDETVGASIMGFDRWDPRVKAAIAVDPRKAFAQFHPWFASMEAAKTQADALAVFVDASLDILARVGPLVLATASAAASDPQMKETGELGEQRRVEGYTMVVELLAKRGKLRRGVDVRRGADILLTILSAETYQHLAVRRGWSRAECRRWFLDVLRQQLLP